VGQAITWASALLLLAAYGRFLGDVKFGELYFALSFVAVIGFPIEFGLNQQLVRDVAKDQERASRLITNALFIKLALWTVLYSVILVVCWALGYSGEERLLVAICGCTLLSGAVASAFGSMHTGAQRLVFPAVGTIIEKGGGALVIILLLRQGAGVLAAAWVLLGASLAGALWQAVWFQRLVGIRLAIDWDQIRGLMKTSVPFLVYGMLGVIYYRIDAVLLSLMASTAVVGWYGASYKLFDTLVFLPNIIMLAIMYPLLSRFAENDEARVRVGIEKSTNFLLMCGLPVATGMYLAAPNIIGFLYHHSDFGPSVPVLQALAPGLVLLYLNTVWTTALMSLNLEKRLPWMAGAALVFNLGLNLLLIPRLQGTGAAITTSLTEGLLFVVSLAFLPRRVWPSRSLVVGAKVACASLLMGVAIVALQRFSILVILPAAAVVYVLAATALGTIPRADMDQVFQAVLRKVRKPSVAASQPRGGTQEALVFSGAGNSGTFARVPEPVSAMRARAARVRAPSLFSASSSSSGTHRAGVRVRQGAVGARRFAAAVLKYATNHIIAHIPIHAVRYAWYRRVLGWDLGPRACILMGQHIQMAGVRTSGKRVSIGAGTVINHGCLLYTTGGLIIGENVSISPGVWLVTGTHLMNDPEFLDEYRPITIDDYAWIGARAMILCGVTIGRGAVVMAGAVVTKDVEPFAVVGGVPAKVVATRELRTPSYALNFRPPLE
jgi:O-antigen/teichoic acid export membrane protein/acetyltransferase-like isoleucine patch superfamily enzyme